MGAPKKPKDYFLKRICGSTWNGIINHWTIVRGKKNEPGGESLTAVRNQVLAKNRKENKALYEQYGHWMDVFDKKAAHEFDPPPGMKSRALFWGGQEVYFVRPEAWNVSAGKGIVTHVFFSEGKWHYRVTYWTRLGKGLQTHRGQQWTTAYFCVEESELYSLSNKDKARQVLEDTLAGIYKWWAEFYDRLDKLTDDDLRPGEFLK